MRSIVTNLWLRVGGCALATAMIAAAGAAAKQCQCDSPPGGGFTCEDNQISCCYIKNGACTGWCASLAITPSPGSATEGDKFAAEIFKAALKRSSFSTDDLTGGELPRLDLRRRDDGQFEIVDDDVHVNVRLPEGMVVQGRAVLEAAARRLSDRKVTWSVQQATVGLPTSVPNKLEPIAVPVSVGTVNDRITTTAGEHRVLTTDPAMEGPPPP